MTTTDTRQERADLCDLLQQLGPDQPTLCEGWQTRDLLVHLLIRERYPLAAAGMLLKPLRGYAARVERRLAARPYDELVDAARRAPAWSPMRLGRVDHAVNTLELFLHHEDVRRAQPDWRPRELPAELKRTLWSRVGLLARVRLRRFPAVVAISAPGLGEVRAGRPPQADPSAMVHMRGDPGELAVFLSGRQSAAWVALAGPDHLTERLAATNLRL